MPHNSPSKSIPTPPAGTLMTPKISKGIHTKSTNKPSMHRTRSDVVAKYPSVKKLISF